MNKNDASKKNTFELEDDFGLEFQRTLENNKKKKEIRHDTSDMLKIGKLEEVFQQDEKPKVKREQLIELEVKGSDRALKRVSYTIELRHIDFIAKYAEKTNRSKNAFLRYMIDKVMESIGEE